MTPERTGQETVSAEDARELLASADERARALDIRSDEERSEGHVPGALHADPDDLESTIDELPDDIRIVVVDADGSRSAEVAATLRERGHDAVSLEGGMEAWRSAKAPLQPGRDFEFEGPPGTPPPGV